MQAIVDIEGRFIDWCLGWPGCVHDSRVLEESNFWNMREKYLRESEYILADKGSFTYTTT